MENGFCRLLDAEEAAYARWWLWPTGRKAHFRAICDNIPALIFLVTPAGEVQIVNRHVLDYFATTPEGLKGQASTDTIHTDDVNKVMAARHCAVKAGMPYEVEARRRRADGVYCWFHMHGFPLQDVQGNIVSWFLLERDVDCQKRAEALLAGEKQVLEMVATGVALPCVLDALCSLFDTTAQGCFSSVIRMDHTRTRVGHVAGPGLPPSYIRSLEGWFVERGEGPCALVATMRTQVIVANIMADPRWKSSGWQALALEHGLRSCWCQPIMSLDSELLGVFAIYRRETGCPTPFHLALMEQLAHIASIAIDRSCAEDAVGKLRSELARVARITSLGALTASIAHEVNQPLSGILTNAGTCLWMLNSDPANIEGARETARRTIRDARRASDVIARLRALFGNRSGPLEPLDLNEATREVIALSLGELQRSRVALQMQLECRLPRVKGDRVQLQQVIMNLMLNALEAMRGVDDRPRQLVIRTETDGEHFARLTMEDSGVGLDPRALDKLFDAFYTTKSGGMGIGLFVSRSIIENHQGRLWAAPNQGPGAMFSFSIPFVQGGRDGHALTGIRGR